MQSRKHPIKLNLIELLMIVVFAYTLAPFVGRFISSYLTTYFYMLLVVVLILLVMFVKGMQSVNDAVLLLVPFLAWKASTFLLPKDDLIFWAYGAMLDILPLLLGYYVMRNCAQNKTVFFSKIIFWIFLITCITTIIGCTQYPDAARYLATVSDANEELAVMYDWKNIGGYNFVYSLVLVHPLLILGYKRNKINKALALCCSITVLTISIYSGYTTAFLLSILSSYMYLLDKDLSPKRLARWLIGAGIIVILFYTVFSNILLKLSEVISNEDIAYRLKALAGGKTGIENSEDNRLELYRMSLNTFLQSPILGALTSGGINGGHSFILDFLAQFGLIGLIILFAMYRTIYKNFFAPYKSKKGYGFVVWLFIQTIFLSIVNTGMWLMVLTVFIPIGLKSIYKEE